MKPVRDYRELVQRLKALSPRQWHVKRVGEVWGYPFFAVARLVARQAPTILLSGGMHGEEPAGVEGVLRWLESGDWQGDRVNWFVLPCINPYGWERDRRTNAQRRDINRQFRDSSSALLESQKRRAETARPAGVRGRARCPDRAEPTCRACPEAQLVKRLLAGRRFLFSMEFHEDWEATGYYLYELRHAPPYVGEKIVRAVGRIVPVARESVIDGNRTTKRGLIRRDPHPSRLARRRRWPMAFWLFWNCTTHVLGSETPHTVPLERRAAAHHVALATALRYCRRRE